MNHIREAASEEPKFPFGMGNHWVIVNEIFHIKCIDLGRSPSRDPALHDTVSTFLRNRLAVS